MNDYKLKNRLWMVIVVLFVIALALAGCSSTPKVADNSTQYCHTYQTINKQNGDTVNSDTVVRCSDDVVGKLVDVRAGLAKNCDYAEFVVKKGQNYVPRKVVLCKDIDGDTNVLFSTVVK